MFKEFSTFLNGVVKVSSLDSHELDDWIYAFFCKNALANGAPIWRRQYTGTCELDTNVLLKDLQEKFDCTIVSTESSHAKSLTYNLLSEDYRTFVRVFTEKKGGNETYWSCTICVLDENKSEESKKYFEKIVAQTKKKNGIYVISSSDSGLSLHKMGAIESPFESGNYTQEVLSGREHILTHFNSENPFGRLAIINGPPGSGKSFLIKSIISEIKNSLIILLPTKMVSEVDSPSLIRLLADEKRYGDLEESDDNCSVLFIVEDADICLVPRESDNASTISSLLNYTDGIFGSMLDLRIIATTNAHHLEFDEALKRPGRMCKHIYVDALKPEKASEVYKRLTGKDKVYEKDTTLAEIYSDSQGIQYSDVSNRKKLGFN